MKTQQQNHQPHFLATTALEEFWDTSKQMVFLGSWCRRYSRRFCWGTGNSQVLPPAWSTQLEVQEAHDHIREVYYNQLAALAVALNKTLHVQYSERFWEILLGPWLRTYIPALYDRYSSIKAALTEYPGLTTVGLSEESFVTPSDTLDFIQYLKGDAYNLQLYTKIMIHLNVAMERKPLVFSSALFFDYVKGKSWREVAFKYLRATVNVVYSILKRKNAIFLVSAYFSRNMLIALFCRTFGKVRPLFPATEIIKFPEANLEMRRQLMELLPEEGGFVDVLKAILPYDIPRCFLEGFHVLQKKYLMYPENPFALFSSNGWYYNELFKFWAAVSAENGAILLGTQHGGNYGCVELIPSEEHEISISDRYYTWGWEGREKSNKVAPFFASKLSNRESLSADNTLAGILYITNSVPRYVFEFAFVPSWFEQCIAWQMRFLKEVSPALKQKLRVRFHREDHGWDIAERWQVEHPEVRVETWDTPFRQSLESSRLIVIDFMSTSCVEALSANKPTVMFWNPQVNKLRTQAQPYFDRLTAAGILHDSPESAANAVAVAYADTESWWNDQRIQDARHYFCERFARTSAHATGEWADELSRLERAGGKSAPNYKPRNV